MIQLGVVDAKPLEEDTPYTAKTKGADVMHALALSFALSLSFLLVQNPSVRFGRSTESGHKLRVTWRAHRQGACVPKTCKTGKAESSVVNTIIQSGQVNENGHLSENRKVFIFMISGTGGNVKGSLNTLFVTLDPPHYSNWSKKKQISFSGNISSRNLK